MRTEKGYRFSLQFPGDTYEERLIGEFLEQLGSKKSRFVSEALREYLMSHPGRWKTGARLQPNISGLSREDLKDIIREVLAERGMMIQLPGEAQPTGANEAGIGAMLDSMSIFR